MELTIYILTTISSGMCLIIAYFLKSVFSDIKKLKEMKVEHALLKQSLKTAEATIKNHHGKIGAQDIRINKFDTAFALILSRLPK